MTTVTLMIFIIGLAVLAAAMIYAAVSYLRFYRREHFLSLIHISFEGEC